MPFDINQFKAKGLLHNGACPYLFEVVFEKAEERMQYLCHSMAFETGKDKEAKGKDKDKIKNTVTFEFYEDEDGITENNLKNFNGPVTIREFGRKGEVLREKKYDFTQESASTDLSWDVKNKIKNWKVKGTLE